MKYNYKLIDTRNFAGLKEAEKLKSQNWKIISVGFYSILFEKSKNTVPYFGQGGIKGVTYNYDKIPSGRYDIHGARIE